MQQGTVASSISSRLSKGALLALCCWGLTVGSAWAASAPQQGQGASQHQAQLPPPAKAASKQVASARPDVHVNRASADELSEALIGVGPAKAKAIVAWRQTHGAFKSLDDLGKVKGIGPSILAKNKPHILFD